MTEFKKSSITLTAEQTQWLTFISSLTGIKKSRYLGDMLDADRDNSDEATLAAWEQFKAAQDAAKAAAQSV